jgi:CubicO group peptidase (beta-lactamase class C family)
LAAPTPTSTPVPAILPTSITVTVTSTIPVPTPTPTPALSVLPTPIALTVSSTTVVPTPGPTAVPPEPPNLSHYPPGPAKLFSAVESKGQFNADMQNNLSEVLIGEFLQLQEKMGISVAVYQDGKIWSQALGYASEGVPMETTTPVAVKSSSKTFLSALVLTQVEEGLYGLNDRISVLLAENLGYQSLDKSIIPDVTIAELLTHTSGIAGRRTTGDRESFKLMTTPDWQPADSFALIKDPPKSIGEFGYHTFANSYLLGMVAEHIGGQNLDTLYRTLLLDPIAVQASLLPVVESPNNIAHPHADRSKYGGAGGFGDLTQIAIWKDLNFHEADGRVSWATAGMVSTSENMARWAYELFSERGSAVTKEVRSALLKSITDEIIHLDSPQKYGFHVAKKEYALSDGTTLASYGHPGGGSGTSSVLIYVPELDLSISVLANSEVNKLPGNCASRTEPWLNPMNCITLGLLEATVSLSGRR